MKIAYISKADRAGGGASLVAEELTRLFNRNGHTAHHYFAIGAYSEDFMVPLYGARPRLATFLRRVHSVTKRMGFPELLPVELLFLLYKRRILSYDIIHFHDLCAAISPLTVAFLSALKPTVWTFHDCSPFTGGCLYPMDCARFRTRCGACPQLGRWPIDTKIDFTGVMQSFKRFMARSAAFTVTTPSRWMADMIRQAGFPTAGPRVLPNGIDTNRYRPANKRAAREKFNIPPERLVILIIAAFLDDERKGMRYAVEALRRIEQKKPYLLIVGHMDDSVRDMLRGFEYAATGFVKEDHLKTEYFSAADVFLFCSLADNMPLVILETMATGTPTVGFATGGVPDMIEHEVSGFLVPPRNVDGLVKGLDRVMDPTTSARWSANARKRVVQAFGYDRLYANHLGLYETEILNRKRATRNETDGYRTGTLQSHQF